MRDSHTTTPPISRLVAWSRDLCAQAAHKTTAKTRCSSDLCSRILLSSQHRLPNRHRKSDITLYIAVVEGYSGVVVARMLVPRSVRVPAASGDYSSTKVPNQHPPNIIPDFNTPN